MNERKLDDLAVRLDWLEMENRALRRRMRRTNFIAAALVIVAIAGAATFQNEGRFEKSVQVFDANKVLRAVMYADSNNKSGLEIFDPKGKPRLQILTNQNDDPYVHLRDIYGKVRIDMGIAPNGGAYVTFYRSDGQIHHSIQAP